MENRAFRRFLVLLLLLCYGFGSPLTVANASGFVLGGVRSVSQSPTPSEEPGAERAWYGNIQYLLNISAIGALSCVLLFVFVKLRSDLKLPGPLSLAAKLLAVWHTTGQQIARTCGANAAQFLYVEGGSFVAFALISVLALSVVLPLNLYAGTVPMDDEFSKTTVTHIEKASSLLWVHVLFMVLVVAVVHFCIRSLEDRLNSTRFHDGNLSIDSVSVFTLMIQGIPKSLCINQGPVQEYFEQRYPGKVYKVVIPPDLAALDAIVHRVGQVRNNIAWLQSRLSAGIHSEQQNILLGHFEGDVTSPYAELSNQGFYRGSWFSRMKHGWKQFSSAMKSARDWVLFQMGFTMEDRLKKLQAECIDLESKLDVYKEGQSQGAGIAFVIFKDIYTANKALQDVKNEKKRAIGRFVSITELQLEKSRWKVERAPPASDIYWHHLGTSTCSMRIRRVAVNVALLILLLFCSSPLAIITALRTAARIINAEAMDNAESWFAWIQSSNWAAALVFQFLPNVLIFISMYLVIPAVLTYLSKFERHLTVSGEHRAALVKTFCFFIVNLIFLRALVESSLEGALIRMGRCYVDGNDCKKIEQYMSTSFLSRSCLSSLAFLITSTFLGISYDLLAPIPWIKRKLKKLRKNDMLNLAPEDTEVPIRGTHDNGLEEALLSEDYNGFESRENENGTASLSGIDLQGQDLEVYPISRNVHAVMQTFDFAQYYAFNLTIFALALIYSSFAPLVVPVGAVYFGYRYVVDKYNFLFVYRIRGFPASNDGKLMATVLRIKRFCVVMFMLAMLFFFYVRGDSGKLQFLFTFSLLIFFCAKCGYDKLLSSISDGFPPALLAGMQTVDNIVDGPTEYEVFAQPKYDLDGSQS